MKPRILLVLTMILAADVVAARPGTPAKPEDVPRPGWLGFGFTYHEDTSSDPPKRWLHVRDVLEGGPAERAGLKKDDVISAIDKELPDLSSPAKVVAFFSEVDPGQKLILDVVRGDVPHTIEIEAAPMPDANYESWKFLWRSVHGEEEG